MFGDLGSLDLQFARIEKPDRVTFHTLIMRPSWFVNIDARKLNFTNVEWDWPNINGKRPSKYAPLFRLSTCPDVPAIACHQLADNAEENKRYEEASKFRFIAMEARRRESWLGFAPWRLSWWYWLASGYGERILRASMVLIGILLVSAGIYTRVGFLRWDPKLASESDAIGAKRDDVGAPLIRSAILTSQRGRDDVAKT